MIKLNKNRKNFLFVSHAAYIQDIAWQILKEGHKVKFYIQQRDEKDVADGFIPKVNHWHRQVKWADVIVFDDVGFGKEAQKLRLAGKTVVGGTPYTDKLEDDRAFGQEEMKRFGIKILPYEEFSDFDKAINYVKRHPGEYVIKPCGDAQNMKRLLYVGTDPKGKDVIAMLQHYQKSFAKLMKLFQLQKKVFGVEIAVGAFFNGFKFIQPVNINFEHKKFFPGDLGPSTGEMGTLTFWDNHNKLFTKTLEKMAPKLVAEGFTGYIDINCIVNETGIYPLEFTTRFGYPTIYIQQEGIINPIGEFLYDLAIGQDVTLKTRTGFQIGVCLVMPPFPYRHVQAYKAFSKGLALEFKKKDFSGLHIQDLKLINNEWILTGNMGLVLTAVGLGKTVKQAQEQVYQRIKNISLPNMYYRQDIGNRWEQDKIKLKKWGYYK